MTRWLLAAVVAVLVTACAPGSGLPRVSVVGDSITAIAQPQISAALDPHHDLGYVFRIGARIDQMLDLVASDLQDNGPTSAAVVNLGTNDAMAGGSPTPALAAFDRLMAVLGPVRCVVLTTIGPVADRRGGSDVGAALNREIAHLAAGDTRRYKVVDWNRLVGASDPAVRSRYLQPDLIHETPAGARWIAASDAAALATCGTDVPAPVIGASGA